MVFSALVDADYLHTEAWYSEVDGRSSLRHNRLDLNELLKRLFDCAGHTSPPRAGGAD